MQAKRLAERALQNVRELDYIWQRPWSHPALDAHLGSATYRLCCLGRVV